MYNYLEQSLFDLLSCTFAFSFHLIEHIFQ